MINMSFSAYPAATSLIPIQVALARFLEQGGGLVFFKKYPYWYLGTTPFRYLTGPILPALLTGLHRLWPCLNFFQIIFLLIAFSWFLGGLWVYWLVKTLKGSSLAAILSTVFWLTGPLVPFLFPFSDGLGLISFSFLPLLLIFYCLFLKKRSFFSSFALILTLTFLMLLNLAILPSALIGMVCIFLAQTDSQQLEKKLRQTFYVLLIAFLLATIWYTPGYWLNSFFGPSLAGKSRWAVVWQLGKLLPTALALVMALFSVKFFKKRNLLRDFIFYWLFIFGFLSLMRFLADPDFWLDWSAYSQEIQLGLGLLFSWLIIYLGKSLGKILASFLALIWIISGLVCFQKKAIATLQEDIMQTVEYRLGQRLSLVVKPGEKVFLSGTTVFWLNAFFDIEQVRGGVDQGSVHPDWRKAAWEIREGEKIADSIKWLDQLGIDYLLIHDQNSSEFYHDFRFPEKYENTAGFKKIFDENGDRIYQRI